MTQAMPTRREVMAGAGAAVLSGYVHAAAAQQVEQARGVVYDADTTPLRGVPGVMVSNGSDVVKTDATGAWSLPVRDGDSVFVIKPDGWMLPIDPLTNLPHFAYVHAPNGSPDLGFRFAGVAASGTLPTSIDFMLRRRAVPGTFNVVLFTDPQPESLHEVGYIRDDVVSAVNASDASFGITHGDVMFDDLSFYPRYNKIIGSIGLPWFNCRGNHDMNLEAPDNVHAAETFKRVFGARNLAFQHGRVTFILLDNVEYLGTNPSHPNGLGKYQGHFGERQIAFIRNVLANVPRDELVVLSFHIPLRTHVIDDAANNTIDLKEFLAAISSHPNTVSFCGHTHTNEHWYFDAADGYTGGGVHHHHILAAVSGSWWSGPFDPRGIPMALQSDGSPNGFHMLSIDGTQYTTTLMPAHDPSRGQMRIMLDNQVHGLDKEVIHRYPTGSLFSGPISIDSLASTRLVVNLFDGGPRSKIEATIGDRPPVTLTKVARLDPFVVETYERNRDTKKPWVEAVPSSHIWQMTLPSDLPPGAHRVLVRASDEYGRLRSAHAVLEVTT